MKLLFVRHGHTNFNRFGIMNDDPKVDVHLTRLGKRQAQKVAEKLKDTKIDYIYASMLPRTFQTAQIINHYHKLKIIQDPRLNDNRTGYNGLPWIVRRITLKLAKDPYRKRFRDGESLEDSQKRIFEFLDEISKKHANETVLIVGHANTGWAVKGYVNKTPLEKMFLGHIHNGHLLEFDI